MLNKFLGKIKIHGQFGVPFQPKLDRSTSEHKTAFGGLVSIILYGLSFAYLVYSNLLPKITSIQTRADAQHLSFESDIISFQPRSDDSINPFDPTALVLIPLVLPFINKKIPQANYFNLDQITQSGNSISVKNFELQYGNDENEIEQTIAFIDCQSALIPSNLNCAKFFDQSGNAFIVTTYVNQFNTNKRTLESVGKEQVIALFGKEQVIALFGNSTYFQTTNLNIQESSVDTGFLFESSTNYDQQLDMSYFQKQFFLQDTYVVFQLRIGKLRCFQSIQYSKISEVLAEAGSIACTLLFLSYIVTLVNQQLLDIKSLEEIIIIYYPNYKEFNIKRSIFGTIQSVSIKGKSQNVRKFKEYHKNHQKVAEKKLFVLNQIYEISRQFLVQNILKSNQIHRMSIKWAYSQNDLKLIDMKNLVIRLCL